MQQPGPSDEVGRSSSPTIASPPSTAGPKPPEREGAVIQRCPRCAARIEGDYRFCPACAFRLRSGPEEPPPAPAPVSLWKRGFLMASAVALVLACVLVGVVLFYPGWLEGRIAPRALDDRPEVTSLAVPALTVADIPSELVEIPRDRFAMAYPIYLLPLSEDQYERVTRAKPDATVLYGLIRYPLRMMRTEVTRGMYEEFLKDIFAHRDRVPKAWREAREVGKPVLAPEDVDLWARTPEPWIQRNSDGEPVSLRVDPLDRNLPVTHVSYVDALGFAQWAGERLGLPDDSLALPLHMEWVAAARGGKLFATPPDERPWLWPWGPDGRLYACNNAQARPGAGPLYVHYPYGEGGASPDGLLAMAGNVAEWVSDHDLDVVIDTFGQDAWVAPKQRIPTPDTALAAGGSFRDGLQDCTVESQRSMKKDAGTASRRDDVGFRLVVRGP